MSPALLVLAILMMHAVMGTNGSLGLRKRRVGMQAPTRQCDVWWGIGVHMPFMYGVMGVHFDQ